MPKGMSADVLAYKALNPSFPHQATADQFFDEGQFEAYRELGYQIAKPVASLLKDAAESVSSADESADNE